MSELLQMLYNGEDMDVLTESHFFLYKESLSGSAVFALRVVSGDWQKWEKLVTSNASYDARLRWGIETLEGVEWGDWRKILCSNVQFKMELDAIEVLIHGTDAGFFLSERVSSKSFVDMRISDMVRDIAQKHKMEYDVEQTTGAYTFRQCHMTDAQFIHDVLLPYAVSATGRADYKFFIRRGDTLVFSTLQGAKKLGPFVVPTPLENPYPYSVQSLEVEYRRIFQNSENSLYNEMRGFDWRKKEPLVWGANDATVPITRLAKRRPLPPPLPSKVLLTTEGDLPAIQRQGAVLWSEHANALFRTELVLPVMPNVEVGMLATLTVTDPKNRLSWASGDWLVSGVQQRRRPKGVDTTLFLERRTYY